MLSQTLLRFTLLSAIFLCHFLTIATAQNASQNASTIPQNVTQHLPPKPCEEAAKRPARILVAYAPDSKSHLRSILPLINRLAEAGHHISIFHITSESKLERVAPNVSFLVVSVEDVKEKIKKEMGQRIWKETLHAPGLAFVYELMGRNFETLLEQHADQLARVLNAQWDLVLVSDLFNAHGYAFAQMLREHSGVPFVTVSTAMLMSSAAFAKGMGQNPLIHPHPFSPIPASAKDGYDPKSLRHRLTNLLEYLGDLGASIYINNFAISPRLAKLTGKRRFTFGQFYAQSEMAVTDSIAHLAFPQPEVTDVQNAGAHCEQAAPLPEDYRAFVEDPKSKGTIYVAFGTFIPWDLAPPEIITAFFDTFERLPQYRIIFSFRGQFPNRTLSPHIRLVSWAPQLELLAHPKTLVFLTHCGLKSIKESLCSRTPMLAMPMFAEQNHNARLVIEFGTGIALNKFTLNADQLYAGLTELLDNPKYGERVTKLQRIFVDRPMNVLDQAEHYIRRIIEKGPVRSGRHFFRGKGIELSAFTHFFVDWTVCAFLLLLVMSK